MSTETKAAPPAHTPGPWELNDLSVESASEGKWIACADSRMGNDLFEDQANARLIAAAPELLEALEALVSKLKLILPAIDGALVMESIHGRPYTGPNLADELKQAEAAIAKAKGEQP